MKIIIVGPDPNHKGGIATLIRNMLKYKNENFKYTMHVARPECNFVCKLILVPLYTLFFIFRIIFLRFDIVHIHASENWGFFRYIPFVLASRLWGIKVIIHSHACEFDSFYERQNGILKKIIRAVLDMADLIITVSPEWAAVFKKISKTRVIVIFNFIDLPEKKYYNKNSIFITTTGQIEKRKGYYDIVKVIPTIIKDNENIRFRFCGNGEVEKISREVEKMDVSNYVLISDWLPHSEIIEFLKDSMIFLLPSYNEGMPMAILEAMSYGIPVISTNVGGIPTLIEHGVNGFLIAPGDTAQLEKSLRLLIDDPDLKTRMSDNNYNKIKNQHSIEHGLMKIYNAYLELNA